MKHIEIVLCHAHDIHDAWHLFNLIPSSNFFPVSVYPYRKWVLGVFRCADSDPKCGICLAIYEMYYAWYFYQDYKKWIEIKTAEV